MSSMVAQSVQFRLRPVTAKLWLLAGSAALITLVPAAPARANDGAEWDVARSQTVSSGRNLPLEKQNLLNSIYAFVPLPNLQPIFFFFSLYFKVSCTH